MMMDEKELRTLRILESAEREDPPSQRDLAQELNISLGLVNSFIKRLVKKGYFKITHIPKNRIKYILTPKGAAEKSRLTYSYIHYSYQFYKSARKKLRDLFHKLEQQGTTNIIFYGSGDLSEIAFISMQDTSLKLTAIVDDQLAGKKFMGYTIIGSSELANYGYDRILITAPVDQTKIRAALIKMGIAANKITTLK